MRKNTWLSRGFETEELRKFDLGRFVIKAECRLLARNISPGTEGGLSEAGGTPAAPSADRPLPP